MGKRILWVVEGSGPKDPWSPCESGSFERRADAVADCRSWKDNEISRSYKYRVVAYVPRDEK